MNVWVPGFMSARSNTKDSTLRVLFISTGIFRLSSVSQRETSAVPVKTPGYVGQVLIRRSL